MANKIMCVGGISEQILQQGKSDRIEIDTGAWNIWKRMTQY